MFESDGGGRSRKKRLLTPPKKHEHDQKVGSKQSLRVHIRRCHLCGGVTESEGKCVSRCNSCGKSMAPFYFFNEEAVELYSDVEMRPETLGPERQPVRGLTAFW